MAVKKFQFSKVWTDPEAFPAISGEPQARENIQALHNETQEFINDVLIPAVDRKADGITDGQSPGKTYRLGVENGRLFFEEVGV